MRIGSQQSTRHRFRPAAAWVPLVGITVLVGCQPGATRVIEETDDMSFDDVAEQISREEAASTEAGRP